MLQLYSNIRKCRQQLGMSQGELAKKAGYNDRSSITKIEKGLVDLPQSKIIQFAKIFGVSPSDLMGDDGIVIDTKPLVELTDRMMEEAASGLSAVVSMYEMFNEEDRAEILALMRFKARKYEQK